MNHSPSSINSFETCPLKFKFIYLDGRKEPSSDAQIRGNLIHEYLNNKGESFKNEEVISSTNFDRIKEDIFLIKENLDEIFKGILKTEEKSFEKYVKFPLKNVIVSGKVDRLFKFKDKIIVTDYKTGKFFEYLKDIYSNLQYLIYCWFVYNIYPKTTKNTIFFEIIQIKNNKIIKQSWPCIFTKDELEKIIYSKIKVILDTKVFLPKKNPFCKNCYFKEECSKITLNSKINSLNKKMEVNKMEENRVETTFNYTLKTSNQNIISLKATLGRSVKEGEDIDKVYKECWDKVSQQVSEQFSSLDLEKL